MGRASCGRSSSSSNSGVERRPHPPEEPAEDKPPRDSTGSAISSRFLLEQQRPRLAAGDHSAGHNSENAEMADQMAADRRECRICFDRLDALQALECASCGASFCASCLRWYIEFKVLEGEVSDRKLVCAAPQCARPLPAPLVEALLSPALFDKYQAFVRDQRAGIRFCPRPGCCAVLDEPLFSTRRRAACPACARESCMRCGGGFHAVPLCRRVDRRLGRWIKRSDARACPRCRASIEKNGGCAHMKCLQCDHEFCWSCRRPWDAHDETLCLPLAFLRSRSHKLGCWAPLRVVTKTAVAGAALVVAVAGAGVAVVVLPPLLAVHLAKDSFRRGRLARRRGRDAREPEPFD